MIATAESIVAAPGPQDRTIRTQDGRVLPVPAGWSLLPPGDAGLTRRVKAATATWTMQEKVGRKMFSRGVWAAGDVIERERSKLEAERATPEYAKRRAADAQRRDREQAEYVEDFRGAVLKYLAFHTRYASLGERMADAVAAHATPVGSGTVARTERIPIEDRAAAAVIAWMRHQTTAYDSMKIERVRGRRREVRRELAERSKRLLSVYRAGGAPPVPCPLNKALGEAH